MKNRYRIVMAAALLVAGLAGGCASQNKSTMKGDKGMQGSGMAMDGSMAKQCAKCGMACNAEGMCPHCDAAKMNGTMAK